MAKAKSSCAGAKHAVHYIERRRHGQAKRGIETRWRGIELTAMRSKGIEWNRQVMIARAKHGVARQSSGGDAHEDGQNKKIEAITDWLYKLFQVVIVEAFGIISSFFIGFKV